MPSGNVVTITGGTNMQEVIAGTDSVLATDEQNIRTNIDNMLGNAQDVTLGTFTESNTFGYTQGGVGSTPAATVGLNIKADDGSFGFKRLQDDVQALCAFLGQTVRTEVGSDVTTSTNITATLWSNMMLNIKDCWDNRFSPASTTTSTDATTTYVSAWSVSLSQETTWTFSSEEDCRGFFNGGGALGVTVSRSGGSATSQNTDWTNLLSAMGEVMLLHDTCSGSTGTNAGLGFYELTASNQQLWQKFGAGAYASNYYRLLGRVNSTTNPTVVTLRSEWNDAHTGGTDSVDGTMTLNSRRRQPDASGSGFSFDVPTDSAGSITGS